MMFQKGFVGYLGFNAVAAYPSPEKYSPTAHATSALGGASALSGISVSYVFDWLLVLARGSVEVTSLQNFVKLPPWVQ